MTSNDAEEDAHSMPQYQLYVVRPFRTIGLAIKRVSGSSGLKVQAAIAC